MHVLWDVDLQLGGQFTEQIQSLIGHAHLLLPILTSQSHHRGWPHQEIGYALALGIPILPVYSDVRPEQMLQPIQGLQLCPDPAERTPQLEHSLSQSQIEQIVHKHQHFRKALYVCAETPEQRAEMLAKYAREVSHLRANAIVRQKGGLSSFHIPNRWISDPLWKLRYGCKPISDEYARLLYDEREALFAHAANAGCRLIVNPYIAYDEIYSAEARVVRLRELLKFLESPDVPNIEVAVSRELAHDTSLTIVGSWFAAEAIHRSPERGYYQTVFTTHAPTIEHRCDLFDQECRDLFDALAWRPESSRAKTIALIRTLL
jgi:hypothetical protein